MLRLSHFQAFFIFILINSSLSKRTCDSTSSFLNQCSETETCIPSTNTKNGYCECLPGHVRINTTHCKNDTKVEKQVPKSSSLVDGDQNSSSGHMVAGILIPMFLIIVVICGAYFNHKYNLINYLRVKINQRNSNYDEVMIGQDLEDDDPPLH